MKKTRLIAATALFTTLAGTAIYLLKHCRYRRKLVVVSEAGYETAHDIFFPLKYKK